jgi:hypothetical protein
VAPALTKPQARVPEVRRPDGTKQDGPREKLSSLEEISSSLLLPDDSASASALPGLEELSGSLLLEEPGEILDEPSGVLSDPSLVVDDPTRILPTQVAPIGEPEPPPPAAHRALLGMPELPKATPAPQLDAKRAIPSAKATLRPAASDTAPTGVPDSSTLETVAEHTDGVPPPPQHMLEALRGYEAAAPPVAHATGEAGSPQATPQSGAPHEEFALNEGPSAYAAEPVQGDVEVNALPRSGMAVLGDSLKHARARLKSIFDEGGAPDARRRWFLPVIALAGLVVGVGLVALLVTITRKNGDEEARGEASASAAAPSAPAATVAPTAEPIPTGVAAVVPAAPAEPLAPPASTSPCKVAGKPRVLAPSAIVQAGIEVRTVGNDVALGFAPNEHQATAARFDPTSLSTSSTVDAQSNDTIRRVVPLGSADGALSIATDVDRAGDALQGRRTVPSDPPVEIGSSAGTLSWAKPGGAPSGKLWSLEGDGTVEALRGASQPDSVTAIAFRMGGAIWMGTARGTGSPVGQGALSRATGSGTVGSPAVAINDGVVLVAWADRASTDDPWRLRWVRFKAGEVPGEPGTFTPPAGGKGEQAMSPGIAAVPGGRFLLVWTEGPTSRHDVRALTLSREGTPIGRPLDISSKSVNAGQGQAAVNSGRQGLVAFLEAADSGFRVVGTPIACAP